MILEKVEWEGLQLLKSKKFGKIFDEKNGNFKAVVRAVDESDGGKEYFVPVEMCLGYFKLSVYAKIFKPFSKFFLDFQELSQYKNEEEQVNFYFFLKF